MSLDIPKGLGAGLHQRMMFWAPKTEVLEFWNATCVHMYERSGFLLKGKWGGGGGGVRLGRMDRGKEKMESPPKLGLGTINIAPLRGRTDLTTRVLRSYFV